MAALKRLFIITGDYSGDVHGAKVVEALRRMDSQLEIAGVGGSHLKAQGVRLLSDQSGMGRVGFGSVLGAPYHYFLGKRILSFLADFRPDAVLLIDYGVFNLHMAAQLKQRGYPVFYFIPPQVWASRKGRIRGIQAHVDHVFCIFPFEEALYQTHGVPVTYVGHPLVGELPPPVDRATFCREHRLNPDHPLVGIFPGSRKLEIDYLLPEIIGSLPLILKQVPNAQFVLAQAGSLDDAYFQKRLETALQHQSAELRPTLTVLANRNHAVLSVADAAIAKSGTVTLEAALYGTPMVILYKMNALVFGFGRRFMYLPCLGLPNILTDPKHPFVPELLQSDANPRAIAQAMIPLLNAASPQYQQQIAGFSRIQAQFNVGNTASNVAQGILSLLHNQPQAVSASLGSTAP
jgi:lipid-A-disaccharide synthase